MIIAISGKIGSGKSTVAEMLKEEVERRTERKVDIKGFSTALKQYVGSKFKVDPAKFEDQHFKNQINPQTGESWGTTLQKTGMEKREEDEDFWVKRLFKSYNPEKDIWIIPDLRFRNEVNACVEKPAYFLIRVDGDPAGIRAASKRDLSHRSETDLDMYTGWDLFLSNTKSVNELKEMVKLAAMQICQNL